jgi:hypothetical protein
MRDFSKGLAGLVLVASASPNQTFTAARWLSGQDEYALMSFGSIRIEGGRYPVLLGLIERLHQVSPFLAVPA